MSAMSILRNFIDLLLFVLIVTVYIGIQLWVPPHTYGFFCGDESLQYPYKEAETITSTVLIAIVFGMPFFIIFITELCRQLPHNRGGGGGKKNAAQQQEDASNSTCSCGRRWRNIYIQYGYFLLGLFMTMIATELPKRMIGRLRPFFFQLCQPRLPDGTTCAAERNHGQYFADYTCDNDGAMSAHMMRDMSMSFPSGHSSAAFFTMVYLAFYLQVTLSTRGSKLLKHVLQFGLVMFALFIALSRVLDHRHHWSDVLAGILIGTVFAWLVARYLSKLFEARRNRTAVAATAASPSSTLAAKMFAHASLASASAHSTASQGGGVGGGLPAYTFGSLPYLQYHGQTYQNYGYVP